MLELAHEPVLARGREHEPAPELALGLVPELVPAPVPELVLEPELVRELVQRPFRAESEPAGPDSLSLLEWESQVELVGDEHVCRRASDEAEARKESLAARRGRKDAILLAEVTTAAPGQD